MRVDLRELSTYFINLERDYQKSIDTYDRLFGLGFKNVNRFEGILHDNPKAGCARSQHSVMSDDNIKLPFILLEDDIVHTGLDKFVFDVPDDADALYLGISQWGRMLNFSGPFTHYKIVNADVVKVYNMLSTHAIVYFSEDYRRHLKRTSYYSGYKSHYHVDVEYAESQKYYNVYALDLPLFAQEGYNQGVTGQRLSDIGIHVNGKPNVFDQAKWDPNKLNNVADVSGVRSFYDPQPWF